MPAAHIKKLYGRSLMVEVLEETLNDTSRKAIEDRKERPAGQPKIEMTQDKDEVEKIVSGQVDLAYKMAFEVLPPIDLTDFTKLKLEKDMADVTDEDLTKAIDEIAKGSTTYDDAGAEYGAAEGDQVKIDFVGKIDGVAFEGGTGTDMPVVLGANGFIPGFEDGLKGAKAGQTLADQCDVPRDLSARRSWPAKLPCSTRSSNRSVARRSPRSTTNSPRRSALEDLDQLKEILTSQIKGQYEQLSRVKLKRQLLDELDKAHTFELPQTLVDTEFDGIWNQITDEPERGQQDLRKRRQDRRQRPCRISQDRGAPRASRPRDRRSRRQEQDPGDAGRIAPRAAGADPPLPRPGTDDLSTSTRRTRAH